MSTIYPFFPFCIVDLRYFNTGKKETTHGIATTTRDVDEKGESSCNKNKTSGWQKYFKLLKKSSIKRLPSNLPSIVVPKISKRHSRSSRDQNVDIDRCLITSTWKTFTLAQLQSATNNFSKENLIGKGGYAEVYKGCLSNGQSVAVKRLNKGVGEDEVVNFLTEIGIIAHVNHPNTAKMIGFGVEGGSFLILQLSSLGSLGSLLQGSKEKLDWSKRYKIIVGTAQGLLYLHEHCERRIIHRDIKADNILLSEDFEPQICDFGLSKWLPKQWSHHNATKFEGTFGYFAPEHIIVDEKTDIFSFGVLLLEIITGRQALDESKKSLVLWAKPLIDNNATMELVDPSLENNYDPKEMARVISTAGSCIQQNPVLRPRMSQATYKLVIVYKMQRKIKHEPKSTDGSRKQFLKRTYSEELSYVEEYNSTKNLTRIE
ncbi:hypothetical protein MIMGU_mgv1a019230mg [Erythranthe guttata]|uniref:non-specific serine/threonine protein kinase n=1 Tax=Erythranthe guttata TaxID=4155 RepID=A0A022R9P7_ERYGU|nr:hypothetical protein MIMGU_mgv1a019230mg [Erythranthe guttata]